MSLGCLIKKRYDSTNEKKFIDRLEELIKESDDLISQERRDSTGWKHFQTHVRDQLVSWQVRVKNTILLIFGENSEQYKYLVEQGPETLSKAYDVRVFPGVLSYKP